MVDYLMHTNLTGRPPWHFFHVFRLEGWYVESLQAHNEAGHCFACEIRYHRTRIDSEFAQHGTNSVGQGSRCLSTTVATATVARSISPR